MPRGWTSRTSRCAVAAVVLSCGGSSTDQPVSGAERKAPSVLRDSLVLAVTSAGTEVWFTLVRRAQHSDGTSCIERGLEIRRQEKRIQVPLLYTAETPTLLNDSTMQARLWTNCVPGDIYHVDLRTGRPLRRS